MQTTWQTRLMAVLLACLCAPAFAQYVDLLGKEAPNFEATVCVNEPEANTLAKCKGNVILLKYWGPN